MITCPSCLHPRMDADFKSPNGGRRRKACNYCHAKPTAIIPVDDKLFQETRFEQDCMRKATSAEIQAATTVQSKHIQKVRYALFDRQEAKRIVDYYEL